MELQLQILTSIIIFKSLRKNFKKVLLLLKTRGSLGIGSVVHSGQDESTLNKQL